MKNCLRILLICVFWLAPGFAHAGSNGVLVANISGEILGLKRPRDSVQTLIYVKAQQEGFQIIQCTKINDVETGCEALEGGQTFTLPQIAAVIESIPNDFVRVYTDSYFLESGHARGFLRANGENLVASIRMVLEGIEISPVNATGVYNANSIFPYILWRIRY